MKRRFKFLGLFVAMLLLTAALAGCGGGGETTEKQTVRLGYVDWDSERASTHVVKEVLENKMGYKVEVTAVDNAIMWTTVAKGDFDAIVSAWLPLTHGDIYAEVEKDVVNLGANLEGAKIGLVVPSYVTINSIEELNSEKDKFKGEIIGIEPGAGIMKATEQAIGDYKLDLKMIESNSGAMAASLKKAVDSNAWVVVTGWTPHWKFAKWDLKYLEDPKGVYGGEEHIATITRKGLDKDMPDVNTFLDKFKWTPDDMQAVMLMIEDGSTPEEAAAKWVADNEAVVSTWLK